MGRGPRGEHSPGDGQGRLRKSDARAWKKVMNAHGEKQFIKIGQGGSEGRGIVNVRPHVL